MNVELQSFLDAGLVVPKDPKSPMAIRHWDDLELTDLGNEFGLFFLHVVKNETGWEFVKTGNELDEA